MEIYYTTVYYCASLLSSASSDIKLIDWNWYYWEYLHQSYQQTGFPCGSVVKNPPVNSGNSRNMGSVPGKEDPLEKEMATHSSILAWDIPWTEEPGRLQSMQPKRVRHNSATEQLGTHTISKCYKSGHFSLTRDPVVRHLLAHHWSPTRA